MQRKKRKQFSEERICKECIRDYVAHTEWSEYCSPACNQKARRAKRKLELAQLRKLVDRFGAELDHVDGMKVGN